MRAARGRDAGAGELPSVWSATNGDDIYDAMNILKNHGWTVPSPLFFPWSSTCCKVSKNYVLDPGVVCTRASSKCEFWEHLATTGLVPPSLRIAPPLSGVNAGEAQETKCPSCLHIFGTLALDGVSTCRHIVRPLWPSPAHLVAAFPAEFHWQKFRGYKFMIEESFVPQPNAIQAQRMAACGPLNAWSREYTCVSLSLAC